MYPVASIGGGCCYFPPCADTVVAGKVLQPRNGQSTIDLFLSITLYVTYDYPRWRRTDFYNGGNDAVYLFPSPLFCLASRAAFLLSSQHHLQLKALPILRLPLQKKAAATVPPS